METINYENIVIEEKPQTVETPQIQQVSPYVDAVQTAVIKNSESVKTELDEEDKENFEE
jgi:hypothetical protein